MAKVFQTVRFHLPTFAQWHAERTKRPLRPLVMDWKCLALDWYWDWAAARGWRLLTVTESGDMVTVVWEGEDTTGSPDWREEDGQRD